MVLTALRAGQQHCRKRSALADLAQQQQQQQQVQVHMQWIGKQPGQEQQQQQQA
jgi:hypothetical protein